MELHTWVVFKAGSERMALPATAVDRVLPRPRLLRLPAPAQRGPTEPEPVVSALLIGNEILPVIPWGRVTRWGHGGLRHGAEMLVLTAAAGRVALEIENVLGVGPLDADGAWAGNPVRLADPATFQRPANRAPLPQRLGRAARQTAQLADTRAEDGRVLRIRVAGALWSIAAADLVMLTDTAEIIPIPGAPEGLLGAVVVRGQAIPVLPLHDGPQDVSALWRSGLVAILRTGDGLVGIPVDTVLGWRSAVADPATPVIRPATLRARPGLCAVSEEQPVAAVATDLQRLLPVMVGNGRFGLMLNQVVRVLPPSRVVRLPGGAAMAAALDGAVAVDGRALPVTDVRRWLGADTTAPGVHVLVRPGAEQHVLVVDSAGRPIDLAADAIDTVRDPAGRFAAIARHPDGPLPMLDLTHLAARGHP